MLDVSGSREDDDLFFCSVGLTSARASRLRERSDRSVAESWQLMHLGKYAK